MITEWVEIVKVNALVNTDVVICVLNERFKHSSVKLSGC